MSEKRHTAERLAHADVACGYHDGNTYATDGHAAIKIAGILAGIIPRERLSGVTSGVVTPRAIAATLVGAPEDVADIAPEALFEITRAPEYGCTEYRHAKRIGAYYDLEIVRAWCEIAPSPPKRSGRCMINVTQRTGPAPDAPPPGAYPALWIAGDGWELVLMPIRGPWPGQTYPEVKL